MKEVVQEEGDIDLVHLPGMLGRMFLMIYRPQPHQVQQFGLGHRGQAEEPSRSSPSQNRDRSSGSQSVS